MAIIKETKGSLKWFLIIVGLFNLLSVQYIIPGFRVSPVVGSEYLIGFIFGIITLYIGIRFASLLQTNAKFIVNFFWVEFVYSILTLLYSVIVGQFSIVSLVLVIINGLILWAIFKNVKRLATQPVPTTNYINS